MHVGFQGSWTDPATKRVDAQARWYTPATGTFASRDTANLSISGTAAANRYTYAGANPLAYNDPTGFDLAVGRTKGSLAAELHGDANPGAPRLSAEAQRQINQMGEANFWAGVRAALAGVRPPVKPAPPPPPALSPEAQRQIKAMGAANFRAGVNAALAFQAAAATHARANTHPTVGTSPYVLRSNSNRIQPPAALRPQARTRPTVQPARPAQPPKPVPAKGCGWSCAVGGVAHGTGRVLGVAGQVLGSSGTHKLVRDTLTTGIGLAMMDTGFGIGAAGVAADATGVGTIVGGPANVAGAALVTVGATTATAGVAQAGYDTATSSARPAKWEFERQRRQAGQRRGQFPQ